LNPCFTVHTKVSWKGIADLNTNVKTIKLLKKETQAQFIVIFDLDQLYLTDDTKSTEATKTK
jgi:hypothetical protein